LESIWFKDFSLGLKNWMGDITKQDMAFAKEVLALLVKTYKGEWIRMDGAVTTKNLLACMFLLVVCLGGMQGFKAVWTNLAGLLYKMC
jgi:hypothetical protein